MRGLSLSPLAAALLLFAAASTATGSPGPERAAVREHAPALERIAALPATLVVVEVESGAVLARVGGERAARRFAPCSTFKVPNALIGLATGAVNEDDDAIRRNPDLVSLDEDWPESWKRDEHRLASAIRDSVLWYFQEVARRVGEDEYRRWLELLDYGNGEVSGPVDEFWLGAPLAISADEQAAFLRRLLLGELPFEARHVALVADAMELARGDGAEGEGWAWYGKTGTCRLEDGEGTANGYRGWLVGWTEGPRGRHVYAFNADMDSFRALWRRRPELVRGALAELELIGTLDLP